MMKVNFAVCVVLWLVLIISFIINGEYDNAMRVSAWAINGFTWGIVLATPKTKEKNNG